MNAILWWVCFQIHWEFARTIPKMSFLGQVSIGGSGECLCCWKQEHPNNQEKEAPPGVWKNVLHLRICWQNFHQLFKLFFPTILTIFFKNFNEISFQLILWFWRTIFYLFFVLMSLTDRHWLIKINWKGIDFCFYFLFFWGLVTDEIFFIMSSGALFKVIKQFVKVVKHKIVCFTWLEQYYSSLLSKPLKKIPCLQGHVSTEGFLDSRPKSVEPLSNACGLISFPEFDKNWLTFFPDHLYEYHPLVSFFSNSLRISPHDPENVFSWSSKHWRSWRMPILLKTRISEHSRAGNSTGYIEKHFTFADLLTKFSPII